MFQMPSDADFEMLYGNLKQQDTIKFWSTSFIRGTTIDQAIVLVDESQNLNFHELDSIITRVGEDAKISSAVMQVKQTYRKPTRRMAFLTS